MKKRGKILFLALVMILAVVFYSSLAGPGKFTSAKANFIRPSAGVSYQLTDDKVVPDGEYAYVDLGRNFSNCWIYFGGDGSFTLSVSRVLDRNGIMVGRYANIIFVQPPVAPAHVYAPGDVCYPNYPPDPSALTVRCVFIRTQGELTADGVPLGNILNVLGMAAGETRYAHIWFWYEVFEDASRYDWRDYPGSAPVQVTAYLDGQGKKYWIIKPHPAYKNRQLTRDAYACDQGVWPMDFELQVAVK